MVVPITFPPLREPIGRKPFLRKWLDLKSPQEEYNGKKDQYCFEDVYGFLIRLLEVENLELAYRFRYTVEAVGAEPFIERLVRLDRALKRAKNRAYKPLERLLDEILEELDDLYDFQWVERADTRQQDKELLTVDEAFDPLILPFVQEISDPASEPFTVPAYADSPLRNQAPVAGPNLEESGVEPEAYDLLSPTEIAAEAEALDAEIPAEESLEVSAFDRPPENLKDSAGKDDGDLSAAENLPEDLPEEAVSASTDPDETESNVPDDATSTDVASPLKEVIPRFKGPLSTRTLPTEPSEREDQDTFADEAFTEASDEADVPEEPVAADELADEASADGVEFDAAALPIDKQSVSATDFIPPDQQFDASPDFPDTEMIPETASSEDDLSYSGQQENDSEKAGADDSVFGDTEADDSSKKHSLRGLRLPSSSVKSTPPVHRPGPEEFHAGEESVEDEEGPDNAVNRPHDESSPHFFESSQGFMERRSLTDATDAEDAEVDGSDSDVAPDEAAVHKSLAPGSDQIAGQANRHHLDPLSPAAFDSYSKHRAAEPTDDYIDGLDLPDDEVYPNLPKDGAQELYQPAAYKTPAPEEEDTAELPVDELEEAKPPPIRHALDRFQLPSQSADDSTETADQEEEESVEPEAETEKIREDQVAPSKSLPQVTTRNELFRVDKSREPLDPLNSRILAKRGLIEIPPPLYRFAFQVKKHAESGSVITRDAGVSLTISKDSIERRMNINVQKRHFFAESFAWSNFRKQEEQNFYHDSTSLIVRPDCIDKRIYNINVPTRHALENSYAEMNAYRAFDSVFDTNPEITNGEVMTESDLGLDSFVEFDPDAEFKEAQAERALVKRRKVLYEKSLYRLNNKDGTLFDYLSGKIAIDTGDKYHIERWVRQQQSVSTEVYRAYAEAVMQDRSKKISSIQASMREKLKPEDVPSKQVQAIFAKLKKRSESIRLKRSDLIRILKRHDFLHQKGSTETSEMSYSNAYSRYRSWRSTLRSPTIEVRQADLREYKPFISSETFVKRISFLDPPQIRVRTSSDYRNKPSLPILDKISQWRKSQVS